MNIKIGFDPGIRAVGCDRKHILLICYKAKLVEKIPPPIFMTFSCKYG